MSDPHTAKLPGSEEHLRPGEHWVTDAAPPQDPVTVTFYLRRSPSATRAASFEAPASREAAEQALTASPQEIDAVTAFAKANGLDITKVDAPTRRVSVKGTPDALGKAFGIQMQWAIDANGRRFLTYEGSITLPAALGNTVEAVLGLSQRSVAVHH